MAKIEILDPTGVIPESEAVDLPTLDTMHGKRIGFRVDWANFDVFCDEADKHLRDSFELQDVRHYHPAGKSEATKEAGSEELKAFAGTVDAMVVGLAA